MYIYTEFKSLIIFLKKINVIVLHSLYCMQICASHILPQNIFFICLFHKCMVVTLRKQFLGIASSVHIFILIGPF